MAMRRSISTGWRRQVTSSWEVNTLARVEQRYPNLPIWQYKADHDQTMFTNYRATEYADEHSEAPDWLAHMRA